MSKYNPARLVTVAVFLVAFGKYGHAEPAAGADPGGPPGKVGETTRGLTVTTGLKQIEKIKADPANVVLPMADWKLDGFTQDIHSEYRESSVIRSGPQGTLTASVPKPGRWHVGVVLYDDGGEERLEVAVRGTRQAVLVADWDDRRQYLYATAQAVDVQAGDPIVLRTLSPTGKYRIETMMLLATSPPAYQRRFEIERVAATIPHDTDATSADVTWTTTWPTRGRVEFGPTDSLGQVVEEQVDLNNHRVRLSGLRPGATVYYRLFCPKPNGDPCRTPVRSFLVNPPPVPQGQAVRERIPLALTGPATILPGWPITGGIPMPRGAIGSTKHVRLLDGDGHEQPLQAKVTSRWDDGSIRWLLLDFQTNPRGDRNYVLEYGRDVGPPAPSKTELRTMSDAKGVQVNTGVMQVSFPRDRFAPFAGAKCGDRTVPDVDASPSAPKAGAVLTEATGRSFGTLGPPESVVVEEQGPMRSVVRVSGRFAHQKESLFRYDAQVHFYAFKPFARMLFAFANDNTRELFTEIESLRLYLPIPRRGEPQSIAAYDDQPPRPLGRIACPPFGGVAVREFWQHWPKTLSADSQGVEIGICPKLDKTRIPTSGTDAHRLYYYLQTGNYKLKAGVSKRHEILVWLGSDVPGDHFAAEAAAFEDPPILTAPPDWYTRTKVFGDIAGGTSVFLPEYDAQFAKGFDAYLAGREKNREYGMLNFGDWWGERGINWGNIEYDTPHAFLVQWARTGDPRYFRAGIQAANHHMDVDLIRHSARPEMVGRVYLHCIGHTGDYYRTSPVEGQGIPSGPTSVSHTWTEGFLDDYFLTGDGRSLEAAGMIASNYGAYGTRNYDFSNCREPGWHLILSMAMYRATRDPFHLNACHLIMDRVLERQTPDGGWRRQLVPGHCSHLPRCHGNAGFMVSVLMTGMRWYHQETNDPRVLESIHRAAHFLIDDMWEEKVKGFRYTSCRGTSAGVWGSFLACDGIGYAAMMKRDAKLAHFARVGIKAALAADMSGMGKSLTQAARDMPHALYYLDELERVLPRKD